MEQILKKMMKTTSVMSESWIIDDVSISSDEDWQLINPSDDENTPDFSFSEPDSDTENKIKAKPISQKPKPTKTLILERYNFNHSYSYDDQEVGEGGDEYKSSDDDGLELNDELVPRSVSDLLGRNRMRKLGKREYSKMGKSKKAPIVYNRAGCVHGKHGLGLKHSLI